MTDFTPLGSVSDGPPRVMLTSVLSSPRCNSSYAVNGPIAPVSTPEQAGEDIQCGELSEKTTKDESGREQQGRHLLNATSLAAYRSSCRQVVQ